MHQFCDKNTLIRFFAGDMQENELIAFSEHLLCCDYCKEAFTEDLAGNNKALSPPNGFSELILRKAKANSSSAFFKYCIKVSVAACFSLVILFSGAFQLPYEIGNRVVDEQFMNQTSIRLEQFRDKLFFREDVNFEHTQ